MATAAGGSCFRRERSTLSYDALATVSPDPEPVPGPSEVQHRIEALPDELLHWLLASRLCESDLLSDQAWEMFGGFPPGVERVQAVCDWIHANIEYGVPSVPTTATVEIFERRGGMCRDFAHLGVTFCRALGIPARYVFGYMPDIGIPRSLPDPGLPRLDGGLARLELVDVRCALQHTPHRPVGDRPRPRRSRRSHGHDLRRR